MVISGLLKQGFQWYVRLSERKKLNPNSNVFLWHTGGQPAILKYADKLNYNAKILMEKIQ